MVSQRPARSRIAPTTPESSPAVLIAAGAFRGTVVRAYGKFFTVHLDDERDLLSTVKGGLKRRRRGTDLIAVGDNVLVTDVGEGEGRIDYVFPRRSALSRLARHTGDVEQVILANPDQALFLFAVREPEPHPRLLDRFLLMAESRNLPAVVGVNKMDLDMVGPNGEPSLARTTFADYETIYPVLYLSVKTGAGLEELRSILSGKVTAVAGPSGVGKSRLLNMFDPERRREVGAISEATGKGRHTTTATILHRIPGPDMTYVADTPGIRALSLQGVDLEHLDQLFPEMRPYLDTCRYADCSHLHEPGCAIQQAVAENLISQQRYASYARLRRGEVADSD